MAMPTNAASLYTPALYGPTVGAGALREDLSDLILAFRPWDNPTYSMAQKVGASSIRPEWLQDDYLDVEPVGAVEGDDWSGTANSNPARFETYTQIYRVDFSVTGTAEAVTFAGIGNPYQWRSLQAGKALVKSIETRIYDVTGTSAPSYSGAATIGTATTSRRMKTFQGLLNAAMVVDAGVSTLDVAEVDTAGELAFAEGAEPQILMCSHGVKADFSRAAEFLSNHASAMNMRNIDAAAKKMVRGVNMYDMEFGLVSVVPNRSIRQATAGGANQNAGAAWLIDKDKIAIATLRPIRHVPMGIVGDSRKGIIRGELAFILKHDKGAAMIKNVTT